MAESAGDRDSVAAVDDVVAVSPRGHGDRRERDPAPMGNGDPLPSCARELRRGAEAGVELGRRLHRPDDRAMSSARRARTKSEWASRVGMPVAERIIDRL
jgi:hypothetical protein